MKHYSNTQIHCLLRCAKQYEFRYIDGLRVPPGVALIKGRAVHQSAARDLQKKIETGVLQSGEAIKDLALEDFNSVWASDEPILAEGETQRDALDGTLRLAVFHHETLAPVLQPLAVERKWTVEVEGYPFELTGIIDVEEKASVRDLKTAAKTPSEGAAHLSDQLTMYAMARMAEGKATAALCLDTLVDLKKGPKLHQEITTRDLIDYQQMLDRIAVSNEIVNKGIFGPCNKEVWWCSERWCGYYKEHCPFGRKGRTT